MRAESWHAILLLALIAGLALSIFAYAEIVDAGLQRDCNVNPFFSCAKVDQSGQTSTLGIPDYAWGIGGFLLLLALDVPLYVTWRPILLHALTIVSAAGALLSVYLAYLELDVIHAVCPVCLGAYLANVTALGCALALEWSRRDPGVPEPASSGGPERDPPEDRQAP